MFRTSGMILSLLLCVNFLWAQAVSLSGTVTKTGGTAGIQGVTVGLAKKPSLSATTNAQGVFTINGTASMQWQTPQAARLHYSLAGNSLIISSLLLASNGWVELYSSDGRKIASVPFHGNASGILRVGLPVFRSGLTMLRIITPGETVTHTIIRLGDALYIKNAGHDIEADGEFTLTKQAAAAIVDTLIATKTGYSTGKVAIDSYNKQNIAITLDTSSCVVPAMPTFASLTANAKFPDPFKFMDGTRMTRKDQWACRRAEINALAQEFLYGRLPPKPESCTGTLEGTKLTIKVTDGGKSGSFDVTITKPSTGTAPYPALIGTCMNSLGSPSSLGIATIDFPCLTVGSETRGQGVFFTIYGQDTRYKNNGNLIAHAWGVDRLIDVLETMVQQTGIDPTRLAVTGCSRHGKSALAIGAFCERIALTLPQESGSGGAGSYRMAEDIGSTVQRLSSTVSEAAWLSTAANQFTSAVTKLPLDQHEIVALCAPRPILIIDNTEYVWLCEKCNVGCAYASKKVWDALGITEKFGFAQALTTHGHCSFPQSQQAGLTAYYNNFLLNKTATTPVYEHLAKNAFDSTKYLDWKTPTLQ
jgi:hypothetical protein